MSYRCQNRPDCTRSTTWNEQTARLSGWIIWSGETRGGQHTTRIYCPECAGRRRDDDATAPGWDAECHTCYARMSDEDREDDDATYSEQDAHDWKRDHECEPDVRLITPAEIEREWLRAAERNAQCAKAVGS